MLTIESLFVFSLSGPVKSVKKKKKKKQPFPQSIVIFQCWSGKVGLCVLHMDNTYNTDYISMCI